LEFELVSLANLVKEAMEELDSLDGNECLTTGYDWLDDKIVGLFKGELMVVGGETGSGKSAFVTNICYKVAEKGHKVVMFALENRLQDYGILAVYFELGRIKKRFGEPNYSWNQYRKNEIKDENYLKLRKEAEKNISHENVFFVKVKKQASIELVEKSVEQFVKEGVKLILIDHLHYLEMNGESKNRAEFIENMMIRIKSLQNRTGARIILVVHYKKLEGKKPMLDSFKDSIAIPQNANYVVNIWRDRSTKDEKENKTTFYLPKVRNPNGEGTVELEYDYDLNDYKPLKTSFGTLQEDSEKEDEPIQQINMWKGIR
jgi:replicative DNA helicase